MQRSRIAILVLLGVAAVSPVAAASAQNRQDPATLIAAQRQAMAPLAAMDGVWREVGDRVR